MPVTARPAPKGAARAKIAHGDRHKLKVTENVCLIRVWLLGAGAWASVTELAAAHPEMSLGTVKNVLAVLVEAGLVRCTTVTHPWQYRAVQPHELDLDTFSLASKIDEAATVFREKREGRAG